MSQQTTMKLVLASLLVFFVVAIGFTLYDTYRSVTANAGEAENQGYEEVPVIETEAATPPNFD